MPSSAKIASPDNFNIDRFIEGLLVDFSIEIQEVAEEARATAHTTTSRVIPNVVAERSPQRRLLFWEDWEPPHLFRCLHSWAA